MNDDREALAPLCKLPDDQHDGDKPKDGKPKEPRGTRMSKKANRLSVKKIEKLKEPGRYHDGRGLYFQITPGGSRSWLLRYARGGSERMLGLGPLHTVSLKQARERAKAARLQLIDGIDSLAASRAKLAQAKLEAAKATTFREAAERYITAHEAEWTNAVHRSQWRTAFATHVYPIIGDSPVGAIDTERVLEVLEPIWTKATAWRLRGRIEQVLDYAKVRKWRTGENPARWKGHLKKLLAKPTASDRHHAAMPYKDVPAFLSEL